MSVFCQKTAKFWKPKFPSLLQVKMTAPQIHLSILNLENVVENLGLIPGYTFVEMTFFRLMFVVKGWVILHYIGDICKMADSSQLIISLILPHTRPTHVPMEIRVAVCKKKASSCCNSPACYTN